MKYFKNLSVCPKCKTHYKRYKADSHKTREGRANIVNIHYCEVCGFDTEGEEARGIYKKILNKGAKKIAEVWGVNQEMAKEAVVRFLDSYLK